MLAVALSLYCHILCGSTEMEEFYMGGGRWWEMVVSMHR